MLHTTRFKRCPFLERYLRNTPVVGDAPAQVVGHVVVLCQLIKAEDGITAAQVTTILTNAFLLSDASNPNVVAAVIECLDDIELILR